MKVKLTWTFSTTPNDQAPTGFRLFYWPKGTTEPTTPNQTLTTSVCSGTNCTYTIDNLSDNVAYDFRINTTCNNGTPSIGTPITLFNVACPVITRTATNNSVSFSFAGDVGPNTMVTGYRVQLFEVGANNTLTEVGDKGILSPAATVTGTFTGLNATTTYLVRVTVKTSIAGVPQTDKVCDSSSITTTNTPSCNAVSNLAGCICGVNCAEACP